MLPTYKCVLKNKQDIFGFLALQLLGEFPTEFCKTDVQKLTVHIENILITGLNYPDRCLGMRIS